MNKDEFIGYLQKPDGLNTNTIFDLKGLVNEFPYCQSTRILLTLNLFKERSINYDSELKATAVHVSSRRVLKKHIDRLNTENAKIVLPDEDENIPVKEEVLENEVENKEVEPKEKESKAVEPVIESKEEEAESIAQIKSIIERHLSELELENEIRQSEISNKTKKAEPVKPKDDLIDDFIKKEPSISRPKAEFYDPVDKAKESIVDHENIVSETLAGILFDQGHLKKSIKIYEKLSLKYPEKSSYFAALIEKAEKELES